MKLLNRNKEIFRFPTRQNYIISGWNGLEIDNLPGRIWQAAPVETWLPENNSHLQGKWLLVFS
jgi:hypothetical protein